MSDLKNLQHAFQAFLLNNGNDTFASEIMSTPNFPAQSRLFIYSNAYQSRLINALASHYLYLKDYLGDTAFKQLALAYIAEHPSHSRSIRWMGDKLVGFIKDERQREIAIFDWLMTLVFDAKDAPIFTLAEMASIAPEQWADLRLVMHPSLHLQQFNYNVVESWQNRSLGFVKYVTPVQWIFWRYELNSRFTLLAQNEAWALNAAISGASFADICAGLCAYVEEEHVALTAATFLKRWIELGLVAGADCLSGI